MPAFVRGGAARTPFGKNVYLRSTVGLKFESYTCAKDIVPSETIDGSVQKILQPGEVLAVATSGPNIGKVGPFQATGTAAQETVTKGGTWSAGTYTLSYGGNTTSALAYNAVAADISAALNLLASVILAGGVTVSGGPVSTTPAVVLFNYGGPRTAITADISLVTGSSPTVTVAATTVVGVAGSVDGTGTLANIVGLNDTFLPWQLLERDVEVASMYIGTAVQGWCFERDTSGARIALTNTTANAMRSVKGLDVTFK